MYKITILTEMTTGHKFNDVYYFDGYDDAFIEEHVFLKAERRGFKKDEVYDYKATIECM